MAAPVTGNRQISFTTLNQRENRNYFLTIDQPHETRSQKIFRMKYLCMEFLPVLRVLK